MLAGILFPQETHLDWPLAIFLPHRRATTRPLGPADAGCSRDGGGYKIRSQDRTSRVTQRTPATGGTGMTTTEALGRRKLTSLGRIRRHHRMGIRVPPTQAVAPRLGSRPGSRFGSHHRYRVLGTCRIFHFLAKRLSFSGRQLSCPLFRKRDHGLWSSTQHDYGSAARSLDAQLPDHRFRSRNSDLL